MFGIFRTEQQNTERSSEKNSGSFGGFSSRLSYEEYVKDGRPVRRSAGRIGVSILLAAGVGLVGVFSGVTLVEFVNSNRSLYFPPEALAASVSSAEHPHPVQAAETAAPLTRAEPSPFQGAETSSDAVFENITDSISRRYRIPVGVMVNFVEPDSPASRAGLCSGDIIVSLDSWEIRDVDTLNRLLGGYSSGGSFTLCVFRNNLYVDLPVSLQP